MIEISHAARALSALGHEARLDIFRFLVRAGEAGATVGQIAAETNLAASTLAHHLRSLVSAGLVTQERQGREIISRVAFAQMNALLSYLTEECCTGIGTTQDVA
ncbi:transcriptional regulator, ArsR family [Jannaschia faecimaris]|uniref:Transcriptional regulator, ArsR family n=1 Tax=Jannaschia faecimaris TaxID=1244108 RepID=A0A1H3PT92_9RHOB|nr:metalloregulator ArsR/SmtB family transcription factor [Jannaschia faecimaris]SDZ04256.1 transcriptional regulator, ArsR family [Jannaschia faecimaris]